MEKKLVVVVAGRRGQQVLYDYHHNHGLVSQCHASQNTRFACANNIDASMGILHNYTTTLRNPSVPPRIRLPVTASLPFPLSHLPSLLPSS